MNDPENGDSALAGELLETFNRFDRAVHLGKFARIRQIVNPAQVIILMNLKKHDPADVSGLRVSELARNLGVTPSNVTQIVTDLETKGLVKRDMDKNDRRAVRVSLTKAGLQFVKNFQQPYLSVMNELVLNLGRDKSRSLISLLSEANDFFLKTATAARESQAERPGEDDKEHTER